MYHPRYKDIRMLVLSVCCACYRGDVEGSIDIDEFVWWQKNQFRRSMGLWTVIDE